MNNFGSKIKIKRKLRKTFLDLINISEVYPNEKEIIEYIEHRLEKFGIDNQRDSFGNLIAKISNEGNPVLLNTHMDVPEANPNVKYIEEGDIIKADGTNILGADPKSGLAVILELLEFQANNKNKKNYSIEAVFTRGEEDGLWGAMNLDYSLLDSKKGIVLDEDGPVTQVVIQAPASVKFDAKFIGKPVHPREPENGINSLQVASEAISSVEWGYSHREVTWNIGQMSSGTARNTVPGETELLAELRSFDSDLVWKESKRIEGIFKKVANKHKAKCKIDKELSFGSYKINQQEKIIKKLKEVYSEMDLKPNFFATFGCSDANIINNKGIQVVAVGSGYYNAHQYSEYIDLGAMVDIYNFLQRFLKNNK